MSNESQTAAAILMLHEQAHGKSPFRFCQEEPCRHIQYLCPPSPSSAYNYVHTPAVAPATLVGLGR